MKKAFFLVWMVSLIFAKEYYARLDPVNIFTIASNVQGEVVSADEERIGKKLSQEPFILIDDKTDRADLEALRKKMRSLKEMIETTKKSIENLRKSVRKKTENYRSIKDLSVKSKTQKDAVFFDMIATENQLLALEKELSSYRSQLADMEAQKIRLEKSIRDKQVCAEGLVLYELLVKRGDVVTPAKPLARVADTSKAILTIFVDANTLRDIDAKRIYIDGKATDYKAGRIVRIADSQNISRYKVSIIVDPPKIFSKLVKVEFK